MNLPTVQIDVVWSPVAKQWRLYGAVRTSEHGQYSQRLETTAECDLGEGELRRLLGVIRVELESWLPF